MLPLAGEEDDSPTSRAALPARLHPHERLDLGDYKPYEAPCYNSTKGIAAVYCTTAVLLGVIVRLLCTFAQFVWWQLFGSWGLFIGLYDFDDPNGCGSIPLALLTASSPPVSPNCRHRSLSSSGVALGWFDTYRK